ncbi:hypothetical protein [Brevundimonas subvibrioides]|uniref:hypothetical protein n=1 Tax=Brevundimonas subvibrioides TaxID=74313 RepID=UPI0022B53AE0|nr:hypothetical protein [Brevundimonas subvibrioides]
MPITLLPRLSAAAVDQLLSAPPGPASTAGVIDLPDAITYGAVGGSRLHGADLIALKEGVEKVAREAGYPNATTVAARATFDAACARHLAQLPIFQSGEAHRDDVWAFIAAYLFRPITVWRYGEAPDRHHGGVRNTFQRLWMRGTVLDRGDGHSDRWGLVEGLTEDAFVAILERPAIAASRTLSCALAEGWLAAASRYGRAAMQPVMRSAVIRIRMRNEIVALGALTPEDLREVVDAVFVDAEATVRRTGSG